MNVLGLFGFGINPGACLLRDGELVAFCEEERLNRYKTSPEVFPGRAVAFVLGHAGFQLADIDRIAFAWDASRYPYGMLKTLAGQFFRYRRRAARVSSGGKRSNVTAGLANALKYTPSRLREEIGLGLRASGLKGPLPPIEFVPHHLSHSYSAYFCSPFDEAIVLTLDGSGEDTCTQVAVARGEELTVVDSIPVPHSLGWFYGAFTAYFGFVPYRHEGKLMALAGLGFERGPDNPWTERLEQVVSLDGGRYEVNPIYTRFGKHSYSDRFTDGLVDFVTRLEPGLCPITANGKGDAPYLQPSYVDLAFGVQDRLEKVVQSLARNVAKEHGIRNLCIAGGVGLNCKMNGALRGDSSFDAVFVQPASYDAGSAVGAAMAVAQAGGDSVRNTTQNAYLGPGYTVDEMRQVLEDCGLSYEECGDVAVRVAEELAAGKTVGWFQGRMEAGPRALGARSILANPALPGVSEYLNRRVKSREVWRPFCPSILEECKDEYLESADGAPFMTTSFQVQESARASMAAVAHVDGSTRPQTVSAAASPLFHRLISEFRRITGVPFVINTSFNVDGEPIVCSPRDAVRCFYSSGLDVLALGPFVLSKT